VIFGREDSFLNLFAKLMRVLPGMALARADAKFQPVFVGDVAECFVGALEHRFATGKKYRLCGPRIYTLGELVRYVGEVIGVRRPIVPLGRKLGELQAIALELMPGSPMTRDNLASMEKDSVCGCDFPPDFGIVPSSLETIAPTYLGVEAEKSRYDEYRVRGGRAGAGR
jgi:NADH dehydrogenase